jgi:hypothetical protein
MRAFLRFFRDAALFIAVAICSAAIAVSCTSCKTTGAPGPVKTVISDVVNCAKEATRETSLHIIDDAASALATANWQGAVMDLVTRWGADAVACVLDYVRGQAVRYNQVASEPDRLEALKAQRAAQWLAENHVVFASAVDGGAR